MYTANYCVWFCVPGHFGTFRPKREKERYFPPESGNVDTYAIVKYSVIGNVLYADTQTCKVMNTRTRTL